MSVSIRAKEATPDLTKAGTPRKSKAGRPNKGLRRCTLTMPAEAWDRLDKARGATPRGEYIASLI